jgi:hypothetical protein
MSDGGGCSSELVAVDHNDNNDDNNSDNHNTAMTTITTTITTKITITTIASPNFHRYFAIESSSIHFYTSVSVIAVAAMTTAINANEVGVREAASI